MTRTKLRASLTEQAAQLGPPWVLFYDKGKPYSIMPAGRCGDVAIIKGISARQAARIVKAANASVIEKREEAMSRIDFAYAMTVAMQSAAAQLVERDACLICRQAEEKLPGHADCWRLVKLAREIRMLGMQRDANP